MDKSKIFYFCFSITICILFIQKFICIEKLKATLRIRKLNNIDYLCDKAGEYVLKRYSKSYDAKIFAKKKPNKAQQAIVDYLRYSKYKYIRNYYPRLALFFFFLVLDIIFVILWITCCGCCCCKCGLFKQASKASNLNKCPLLLSIMICYILVAIFSILMLILINPFTKRINGVGCALYSVLEHIKFGTTNIYSLIKEKWPGLLVLKETLIMAENQLREVSQSKQINDIINFAILNYTFLQNDTCGIKTVLKPDDFQKGVNNLTKLLNTTKYISFNKSISNIDETYNDINEIENDEFDNIHDSIRSLINRALKIVIFTFYLFVICFIVFSILLFYLLSTHKFRIAYGIIWNISMFLMILSILISLILGTMSYLLKDARIVIQYIVSPENYFREDPILIRSKSFIVELLEKCVNGNGIIENTQIKYLMGEFSQTQPKYTKIVTQLQQLDCSNNIQSEMAKNSLITGLATMLKIMSDASNLGKGDNYCIFAKNEEMVIFEILLSSAKFGTCLCSFSFLIGIFLGISVILGILLNYKYSTIDNKPKVTAVDINNSKGNLDILNSH